MPKQNDVIRVGSRASRLALTQAKTYLARLKESAPDLEFEIIEIQTSGDRFGQMSPEKLLQTAGKGIFVKELEEAILEGRVDLAIHSLKDVPGELPKGLILAGYQEREDPRDAWVSRGGLGPDEIADGAVIGTSSPRRRFQLLELFRSKGKAVSIVPLRGNVDTRLRKAKEGALAATVLSLAGLRRLGLDKEASYIFDPIFEMTPPCGQGTLAAEIRGDRSDLFELLSLAEDRSTRLASELERLTLRLMGGGCLTALGIYARPLGDAQDGEETALDLSVYQHDGISELSAGLRSSWKISSQNSDQLLDKILSKGAEKG